MNSLYLILFSYFRNQLQKYQQINLYQQYIYIFHFKYQLLPPYQFKFTISLKLSQQQQQLIFSSQNIDMDISDDNSPQAINQTYKIWKKNVPFLYNILHVYQLPSCSQTVEWLTDRYILNSWEVNNLVIGSNSIVKNSVSVIQVKLPTDDTLVDYTAYKQLLSANESINSNNKSKDIGTLGQQYLNITKNFPQDGQIMKIRAYKGSEKNGEYLAISVGGTAPTFFVYDIAQDVELVDQNKLILDGHQTEGFGIDWSPMNQSMLATGAFDQKVCIWNLKDAKSPILQPQRTLLHNSPVQDVKWCPRDTNVVGSACQDKSINIWDLRENSSKPTITKLAHNGEVYSLDFNNFSQYLLLSGGQDSGIVLWDTRDMSKSLHTFIGHNDIVSSVKWSTANPYTFTSTSFDHRAVVWDIRNIDNESSNMNEQQSNEIKFIHGGHRTRVTDFCWNQEQKVCASVQQNNILHVWQMNQKIDKQ